MRKIPAIKKLLKDKDLMTKIRIFFSTKAAGDDFDPYEDNYQFTNLNPITIKGYVRDVSPEALVWKQYGLDNVGAKEIICEEKYKTWFENCSKIEIDSIEYQVFREGTGNRSLIVKRPYQLIRVVVTKNG